LAAGQGAAARDLAQQLAAAAPSEVAAAARDVERDYCSRAAAANLAGEFVASVQAAQDTIASFAAAFAAAAAAAHTAASLRAGAVFAPTRLLARLCAREAAAHAAQRLAVAASPSPLCASFAVLLAPGDAAEPHIARASPARAAALQSLPVAVHCEP
jgi:hypothetical protein